MVDYLRSLRSSIHRMNLLRKTLTRSCQPKYLEIIKHLFVAFFDSKEATKIHDICHTLHKTSINNWCSVVPHTRRVVATLHSQPQRTCPQISHSSGDDHLIILQFVPRIGHDSLKRRRIFTWKNAVRASRFKKFAMGKCRIKSCIVIWNYSQRSTKDTRWK